MTLGPNVLRFFRQGSSGSAVYPDRAETRAVAGFVRADRAVGGFAQKTPGKNVATETATDDSFSHHSLSSTDSTDCTDKASKPEGFSRQGTVASPDQAAPSPDETPPWDDDREWLLRWRHAGTTLASREPVLRAWLATIPPGPLPRVLPALELARIARQYGVTVEIEPRRTANHGVRR